MSDDALQKLRSHKIQSMYAEQVEKLFPREAIVCDVGGGTGEDACYFLQKGHQVTLIDQSESPLLVAKRKAEEMGRGEMLQTRVCHLEEEAIPLPGQSQDIVYSRLVLHFFLRERTIKILKEIKRILKKTGMAYIIVKSPEDKEEMSFLQKTAKQIAEGIYETAGEIKTRFRKDQWEEMLSEAGIDSFRIQDHTEDLRQRGDVTISGNQIMLLTEMILLGKDT